ISHKDEVFRRDKEAVRVSKIFPFLDEMSGCVENLNSRIFPIADIDQVFIDCNRVGKIKLSGSGTLRSPCEQELTVLVEFEDPRIAVTVCDVNVSSAVECDIRGLIEMVSIISRLTDSTKGK